MVCFKTLQELRRLSSLKRIEKQKHVFFFRSLLIYYVVAQGFPSGIWGYSVTHLENMNIIVAAEFPPVELFF